MLNVERSFGASELSCDKYKQKKTLFLLAGRQRDTFSISADCQEVHVLYNKNIVEPLCVLD